jgi:hypothetical protein
MNYVRSINEIMDDELKVLKSIVPIDRQLELAVEIRKQELYAERNEIISNAFCVSSDNSYPSALEKIAMLLQDLVMAIADISITNDDDNES